MTKLLNNIFVFIFALSSLPCAAWAGEKKQTSALALTAEEAATLNRLASDGSEEFGRKEKRTAHDDAIPSEEIAFPEQRPSSTTHIFQAKTGKIIPVARLEGSEKTRVASTQAQPTEGTKVGKNSKQKPEKQKIAEEEKFARSSDHAEDWFFHTLPRHIGQDLKYSFWNPWQALIIAAGAGLAVGVHTQDTEVINSVKHKPFLSKGFNAAVEWGFHPIVLGSATLLALGAAKLAHSEKAAIVSGTMLEAFTMTEVATIGLQYAVNRKRPDGSPHGFPSAHTSGAFALASVATEYYGPWVGIPSFALASFIGLVRVNSLKHFPSDVVAGAALGTVIGLGTAKFHKKEFKDYFIIPTVSHNSAGISVYHPF